MTPEDFHTGPAVETERRREPRFPCSRQIEILPCAARPDWNFLSVALEDCSPNGLALLSPEPIAENEQFLAKLLLDGVPTMLVYTVRSCRTADRAYRLGAEFSGYVASPYLGARREVLRSLLGEPRRA